MTAHPKGELVGRFHLGRQMLDGNLLVSAECSRVRILGYVIASVLRGGAHVLKSTRPPAR